MSKLIELERKNSKKRFKNYLIYNCLLTLFLIFFCINDLSIKIVGMSISGILLIAHLINMYL